MVSTSKEINFAGYPIVARMMLLRDLNYFISTTLLPDYRNQDYEVKQEETYPFRKKTALPPEYRDVQSYKYTFKKGTQIGTSLTVAWDEKKFDTLDIEAKKDSPLRTIVRGISIAFCIVLCYGITFLFYQYWFVVIVAALVICICIGILLAALPALIGIALGSGLSWIVLKIIESKDIKAINSRDREHLFMMTDHKLTELMGRLPR
jgi:hypothetical protein